jgi:hypothetical protein
MVTLTAFLPGTTVHIVRRTHANDQPAAWEFADARMPAATLHRAPRPDEIIATVAADEHGRAPFDDEALGERAEGQLGVPGTPTRGRFWALGQFDGAWRRVAFSASVGTVYAVPTG